MSELVEPHAPSVTIASEDPGFNPRSFLLLVIPLLLLVGVLAAIFATDGGLGDRETPPIETLSIQQVRLPEPGLIEVRVVNDGPDEITIAQVQVDDAYWQFSMSPDAALDRLESATVSIPYPWVQDEAHAILLISSTGVTFPAEIPVAMQSPERDAESFVRFGLVGIYVGVVPVALGLLWLPFLRRIGTRALNFVLALTIGLLVFLVVDMFEEARETALTAPASFDLGVVVPILALLTAGLLVVIGSSLRGRANRDGEAAPSGKRLAYQIAIGIGLHNLGEGLAIGSAFALGEVALGVFLIVGFTLHNVTEGIGIAAPVAREKVGLGTLVALAAVAGAPAILGTWIGAFTYSPVWSTIFLAIGVGAILQVIYEVWRLIQRNQTRLSRPALDWGTFGGIATGVAVMYVTALLIV